MPLCQGKVQISPYLCGGRGVRIAGNDRGVTPHAMEEFVASVCSASGQEGA